MILTTTNSIEGANIVRYFDPISKSIVLGSNVIVDFGASVTDFFGGRSNNYENRYSQINSLAMDFLKTQARKLKANAVVGIKLDVGEISGGGKNMLMVTVLGTPVVVDIVNSGNQEETISNGLFVHKKMKAKSIIDSGQSVSKMKDETIQFIVESGLVEFEPVVRTGLVGYSEYDYSEVEFKDRAKHKLESILSLLENINFEDSVRISYDWLIDEFISPGSKKLVVDAIGNLGLVNYDKAESLLNHEDFSAKVCAIHILSSNKEDYTSADVSVLERISNSNMSSFFKRSESFEEKGILGTKYKWACKCGSGVSDKEERCSCGRDRFGFKEADFSFDQMKEIVKSKLDVIKTII